MSCVEIIVDFIFVFLVSFLLFSLPLIFEGEFMMMIKEILLRSVIISIWVLIIALTYIVSDKSYIENYSAIKVGNENN